MWVKLKTRVVFVYQLLREAARRYGEDRVGRMAAAVAYRTMFSLAPLILIAVAVFGMVIGDSALAREEVLSRIRELGGDEVAGAVETFVGKAVSESGTAAIVGFILLLWTASSLFLELQNDLIDIFDVPEERTAGVVSFLRRRGLGFLWTLGLGVILIVVWALQLVWGLFEGWFDREGLRSLHELVTLLSPFVSLLILPVVFALIFRSLTHVDVRRRAIYVGSIFTSIVFLLAAYGIRLYFTWGSGASPSQVAGTLFVILLAASTLSTVFLFGAEVTKSYDYYQATGSVQELPKAPPPAVVTDPGPAAPTSAILGFLAGLVVGRRRRR